MSNSKQKIKLTLWLSGIILFGATLYVSGLAFAKPVQAGWFEDWLCNTFGECGQPDDFVQPAPQPQPQPQPQPSDEYRDEASDESSGRGGEDSGFVSRSICEGEGGRVESDFGRTGVLCVFPYTPPSTCNFNGKKDPGEDPDTCSDFKGEKAEQPLDPVRQALPLFPDCGCTTDGYKIACGTTDPTPSDCSTRVESTCNPDYFSLCSGGVPSADGADGAGSGGQDGQGGTGGQGSSEGIFGPGGLFGPGGSFGGDGDGAGAGSTQCSDGQDNDGDGKIDREDPGCNSPLYNPADNSELNYKIREVIPDFFNLNWFKVNVADFFRAEALGKE